MMLFIVTMRSALVLILSGRAWDRSIVVSYQNDPSHELGLMCFRFIKLFASGVIMKNSRLYWANAEGIICQTA